MILVKVILILLIVVVSKVNGEKLFYLMSKGLSEEKAKELLILGFISDFKKSLPMEYAVELNRLLKDWPILKVGLF